MHALVDANRGTSEPDGAGPMGPGAGGLMTRRLSAPSRYVYLGDRWSGDAWRGASCDPLRDARGKAVVGRGNAAVVRADGSVAIVNRRRLRLREKYEARGRA